MADVASESEVSDGDVVILMGHARYDLVDARVREVEAKAAELTARTQALIARADAILRAG